MKNNIKKTIFDFLFLILIVACVLISAFVLKGRAFIPMSILMAVLSCIPFFASFEREAHNTKKMVILAVMTALSVFGRFAFSFVPHFKPVTAIVIITGIYLGAESGFLCGALSAILSNIMFGQGPWTPFQMFSWGIIGFLSGLLAPLFKKHRLVLWVFGALFGILFSALMDVWTVMWLNKGFSLSKYISAITLALPITAEYAVSNIIFLICLAKPMGEKLDRIVRKYGI